MRPGPRVPSEPTTAVEIRAIKLPLPPKSSLSARVGVEVHAPMPGLAEDRGHPKATPSTGVTVEAANRGDLPKPLPPRPKEEPRTALPWLTQASLDRISDPMERFTLHFMNNLVGDDLHRPERRLGAPLLFDPWRRASSPDSIQTALDQRDHEDRTHLLAQQGPRMLDRPLQKTLRQSTILRDLELELEGFKADHVPFSEPYDAAHGERHWGHATMRFRPTHSRGPVEVGWVLDNLRLATSADRLKTAYTVFLDRDLRLSLRAHYDYQVDQIELFGDLHWQINRITGVHVLAGSRTDLMSGSRTYPIVTSPVVLRATEESPGVLVYVEHTF